MSEIEIGDKVTVKGFRELRVFEVLAFYEDLAWLLSLNGAHRKPPNFGSWNFYTEPVESLTKYDPPLPAGIYTRNGLVYRKLSAGTWECHSIRVSVDDVTWVKSLSINEVNEKEVGPRLVHDFAKRAPDA